MGIGLVGFKLSGERILVFFLMSFNNHLTSFKHCGWQMSTLLGFRSTRCNFLARGDAGVESAATFGHVDRIEDLRLMLIKTTPNFETKPGRQTRCRSTNCS